MDALSTIAVPRFSDQYAALRHALRAIGDSNFVLWVLAEGNTFRISAKGEVGALMLVSRCGITTLTAIEPLVAFAGGR
jgi:hypothetical protein